MLKWRFTSKEETDEAKALSYTNVAIENEKQRKTSKSEKKAPILSEFFQKKLDDISELAEAFRKFSAYKQYQFLEYIETAKREETKCFGIEKIIPMVLENFGFNDKYR